MRLFIIFVDVNLSFVKLNLSLVSILEEVCEVQCLCYKVFIEVMNLLVLVNFEGLDKDEFDDYCDYLIVCDSKIFFVVGIYCVLSLYGVCCMGKFYLEQEFDFFCLDNICGVIVEVGCVCIYLDYCSGGVIMMLWVGLVVYMCKECCEYLMGCVSVSLVDGGYNVVVLYYVFCEKNLVLLDYCVMLFLFFLLEDCQVGVDLQILLLLCGYLCSGVWVCGELVWDFDFYLVDFFLLLLFFKFDSCYVCYYFKELRIV